MVFDLLPVTVTADGSGLTPTTANQELASIAIPENRSYKYILVHFQVEVAMVSSPVVQQIDLELLNDSTVVKTFNWSAGATDVVGIQDFGITWPVAKNNSGTISLQLGNAAAADVDSSIMIKGIWAAGVS